MGFRIVRDDDERAAPVIVMKDSSTDSDPIMMLKKRIEENKQIENFFKEITEKSKEKDKKKPGKIAVGMSAGEVFAAMIISAFPIVAISTTVMSYCVTIIKYNLHEMLK